MDFRTHDEWLDERASAVSAFDRDRGAVVPVQPKDELHQIDDETGRSLADRTNRELQPLHRFLSWQISLGLSGCGRDIPDREGVLFSQGTVVPRVPPIAEPSSYYDPRKDEELLDFLREARAESLEVCPSRMNGELALALDALLDPATAQAAWATPDEILQFERDFLEKTIIESYANGSTPLQIQNHITRTYRIGPMQAKRIHSCCMAVLVEGAYMTEDYRKAIMDYTLGSDIRRSINAGDTRGALAARKLQSAVHQLIQPKKEEGNNDGNDPEMRDAISTEKLVRTLLETTAKLSREDERRQLDSTKED